MNRKEKKRKSFIKGYHERNKKIFAEAYGIPIKSVKKLIKGLNSFSKEEHTIRIIYDFLHRNGLEEKVAKKLLAMLMTSDDYIVDKIDDIFLYRKNDKDYYAEVKQRNYLLYLGGSEIERRNDRRLERDGNQKLEWKDVSELSELENNFAANVCGEILVTGPWDEDEPPPNHRTYLVQYLTGWAHPEVKIEYEDRSTPWPYASRIEKWMHLPSYKQWERL
jgi:hypothetical protein